MGSTSRAKLYLRLSRPRTALSTFFASMGGVFYLSIPSTLDQLGIALLTIAGVVAAHLSANAINEYVDYRTGVDLRTRGTPFSGGTKVLVEGLLRPGEAMALGMIYLAIAISSGVYLTMVRGPLILILALAGAFIVIGYSVIFTRTGLGELSLIAKGALVFAGSTYAVTGSLPIGSFLVGAIYGASSSLRLLMRHIPDREADRDVGRKTIPVILGERTWIVSTALASSIATLVTVLPLAGVVTKLALTALPPAILGIWVAFSVKDKEDTEDLVKALRRNAHSSEAMEIILTISIALGAAIKI